MCAPLAAQEAGPKPGREVQLTFGYKCGNEFVVRNDTPQAIDLEFQVEGRLARAKFHLKGLALLEIKSSADAPLQLLVNGTVVASAVNGRVDCPAGAE
jgi:hypothetical protein